MITHHSYCSYSKWTQTPPIVSISNEIWLYPIVHISHEHNHPIVHSQKTWLTMTFYCSYFKLVKMTQPTVLIGTRHSLIPIVLFTWTEPLHCSISNGYIHPLFLFPINHHSFVSILIHFIYDSHMTHSWLTPHSFSLHDSFHHLPLFVLHSHLPGVYKPPTFPPSVVSNNSPPYPPTTTIPLRY